MDIKESPNTEIRNLREGTILILVQILHVLKGDWKKFMSLIPMDPQKENSEPKYNSEHVRLIEGHAKETKEEPAKILFDEWGTSGQIRPTLRTVQQIALKAQMIRLADQIADMLGEPRPPRPKEGPGAPVNEDISDLDLTTTSVQIRDTTKQMGVEVNKGTNVPNWNAFVSSQSDQKTSQSDQQTSQYDQQTSQSDQQTSQSDQQASQSYQQTEYQQSLPNIPIFQATGNLSLSSRIDPSILQDTNLIQFDYNELEAITDKFSNAFKIGAGGFGDVYRAPTDEGALAIKKTRMRLQQDQEDMMILFNNEVKYLSQFRHENIVPILGFAKSPVPCIVCEYIAGGSLFDKIAERVLSEAQRLAVMRGAAEGLRYLHSNRAASRPAGTGDPGAQSASRTNFVHGDVKSANILLTLDFVPKLCDFGLTKQYDYTFIQPTVIGTKVYMAPEALSGSVTPKSDIYSYGVVLLELLTALRPRFVVDGSDIDIKLYIDEGVSSGKTILDFLDQSAQWTRAEKVFALARHCLMYDRRDRPSSEHICQELGAIQGNSGAVRIKLYTDYNSTLLLDEFGVDEAGYNESSNPCSGRGLYSAFLKRCEEILK